MDSNEISELREHLATCDHAAAKAVLIKTFANGVIPKRLAELLDAYIKRPGVETAVNLISFDPKLLALFDLAEPTEAVHPSLFEDESPKTAFKPDYGLYLVEQGVNSTTDLFFYDFPLNSLTILGSGEFSTMSGISRQGKTFMVSLDFNQAILDRVIQRADPAMAEAIRVAIRAKPGKTVDLPGVLPLAVRTRLGKLQSVERERFVPLVVQELL